MPKKNKLSIYLIKDEFAKDDKLILKERRKILGEFENVGIVYYDPSVRTIPSWLDDFFCGELMQCDSVFTSNARAVLITRVNVEAEGMKTFAVTMGYGKYLLGNDVVENDFGIKVVLNSINRDNLRKINKTNIGGNQKSSSEQMPLASDIDAFGFDIENDLISAITGRSGDKSITDGMMYGSDLLSLTAEVDVTNIKGFLQRIYKKYQSDEYKHYFDWIDHIKKVKDKKLILKLEQKVVELIKEKSPLIWMAVPEVIEWENVAGFKYTDEEKESDIEISKVIASLKKEFSEYDQLRNKTIKVINSKDDSMYMSWRADKCLYGEVEEGGKAYCINNGYWYCIDKDFVRDVDAEYNSIRISDMDFMECKAEYTEESEYTVNFVETNPDYMVCMDRRNIVYGGGHSKIELCDILTMDQKYIHIKPYSGSSTLSHLFNQAVVSAELILTDKKFLEKANDKIKEVTSNEKFLVSDGQKPHVILAIISKHDAERPRIPFFSKVALRHTVRSLKAFGCDLEIKNIKKQEEQIES